MAHPDSGVRTAGSVTLIGAGPGDPDLITVAGLEALRAAEVVVHDRLASPELLREARPDARLIDAGKTPGGPGMSQDAINAVLVEQARAGRVVARLKGGDPFVFGRGGEEALALRRHGIPFTVVPGVTSAVAAPACAGIPITHRGIAGSVLIATGHEAAGGNGATCDWQAVARAADTLVFLMGVERLEAIAGALLAAGRPAAQPAALVQWGTTTRQRTLAATLGTIAAAARAQRLPPPATLVVGEVVRLRESLAWFEARPLFGARVLVTRSRDQSSRLVQRLHALGATALEFPAIACLPASDPSALDNALNTLDGVDWVVFTSANGVRATFARLAALSRDARALGRVRVCAIGPATVAALDAHGIRADLVPERYTTAGVLDALIGAGVSGARVLLARADIAPSALADGLTRAGAAVDSVVAYRTVRGEGRHDELARLLAGGIDVVTLTSSSTVANLMDVLGDDRGRLAEAAIVSIGPMTSAAAERAGLTVAAEAAPHTIDGLIAAVCRWRQRHAP